MSVAHRPWLRNVFFLASALILVLGTKNQLTGKLSDTNVL